MASSGAVTFIRAPAALFGCGKPAPRADVGAERGGSFAEPVGGVTYLSTFVLGQCAL
jgi:hypothetical protein